MRRYTNVGEFVVPVLQELYDTLVAQGSQSELSALKVGEDVELADIDDLEHAEIGMPSDVVTVYENLKAGSFNHADMQMLKKVMVKDSYDETIQVWALSIALNDRAFHRVLKQYWKDPKIDAEVETAVHKKTLRYACKDNQRSRNDPTRKKPGHLP